MPDTGLKRSPKFQKGELANYGGQILDSLTPSDQPWTRSHEVKPASRFPKIVMSSDTPFRTVPLEFGVGNGNCLQSMKWESAFTARIIARHKGAGLQPVCVMRFATWEFSYEARPKLQPNGIGGCPNSVGNVAVAGSLTVTQEGKGQGTAPFELTLNSGHVANTIPESGRIDDRPGSC